MKSIEVVAAIIRKEDRVFANQRGYGPWKDFWEWPCGKSLRQTTSGTLIPPVVALDSLDFAIANPLMRLHSDKFHHLHSNGDLHILAFCSLFHLRVILIAVEQSPRVAAPPLGMGPEREKRNRHPFRGWMPVHSLL